MVAKRYSDNNIGVYVMCYIQWVTLLGKIFGYTFLQEIKQNTKY